MKNRWGIIVLALWGLALVGGCSDLPTMVGEVCQTDDHCGGQEESLTLTCDHAVPGGSCTVSECTPDNPDTEALEDEMSCPQGARCVQEHVTFAKKCRGTEPTRFVCRRECEQQSDCGEVILCGLKCEIVDDEEVCEEECKNRMECVPFWSSIPADVDEPPRACVLYGSDCVYAEPEE
jgi:hypothetical protein